MNNSRHSTIRIPNLFQADSPLVTVLLAITVLLAGFGLLMVLSASSVVSGISNDGNFFHETFIQFISLILGGVGLVVASRLPITFWQKSRNYLVGIVFAAQALVLFTPLGIESGGNRNWLDLGFTSVQPSEFLKPAIIVWIAVWIHDNPHIVSRPMAEWGELIKWVGIPFAAVVIGRDIGTAIVLFLIIVGMLAFAGVAARPLWSLSALALLGGFAYIALSDRRERFIAWIFGCAPNDFEGVCWQSTHGYWALGSGGFFGLGAGSSRAKWSWLPHAESDYIFAIIGEEFGLLGALFLLITLAALGFTFVRLMRAYPQPLTRTLIGGVFIWLVGQSFINIGVVLGVLPVLGVPLPMISSGGSAIVANLAAIGVVVSCVRFEERYG
ncbi:MAG: FtsW/RodA/SpoVE family cell cycle protein [Microbacteriaceae bacterium]